MSKSVGGFSKDDLHGSTSSLGGNLGERVHGVHSGTPAAETGGGEGTGGTPPAPVSSKYGKPSIPTTEEAPKPVRATGGVITQEDVDSDEQAEEDNQRTHDSAVKYNHTIDNEMQEAGQARSFGTVPTPQDEANMKISQKSSGRMNP